jgi:ribosome-associated protein
MMTDASDILEILPGVTIPLAELSFRTSRSGGPGGQHVNKVETRVELLFDVAGSPSLDDARRAQLLDALATRLDSAGVLHVVADSSRSQLRNRDEVVARFVTILQAALRPRKPRRPTRIPRSVKEARLQAKKQRGETKRMRRGEE